MIDLNAVITCPQCGFAKAEQMPHDTWVIFYQCASCGALLHPKAGDCCVYCSYADKHCPSKQQEAENQVRDELLGRVCTVSVETIPYRAHVKIVKEMPE